MGKDPYAGKDLRWEEKWTTEDEMVGHNWWKGRQSIKAKNPGSRVCKMLLSSEDGNKGFTHWNKVKVRKA